MQILPRIADPRTFEGPWLAVGHFEAEPDTRVAGPDSPLGRTYARLLASKDLSGSVGEMLPLHEAALAADAVLAFGLGPREKFDPGAAFAAGVAVGKRLASRPRGKVGLVLPATEDRSASASLIEGVVVGTRGPGLRKSEPSRHEFEELHVLSPEGGPWDAEALARLCHRAEVAADAVNLARELVNLPPSEKRPAALAGRVRELNESCGVTVDVWDRARIESERFGGLLGVAAGSDEDPAFVTLDYRGGGDGPTLALVGKGVTFDSGGLSLKPSASMEDMKADMTGAAVVAATIRAAARLKLPVNLAGYLALTENMTGGSAMKLGDVLTMRNGVSVEVLNTDAEGRLILADALAYAAEQRPARMIDLATLTGACMVALGTKVAGLFSTDAALAGSILAACRKSGERAWRMPLDDDFEEALKSSVADSKNVGGKWGGAITAAKFLQKFVGQVAWAHLDIAGPSWSESESATRDAGGTGCFVRTLLALIEQPQDGDPSA